MKFFFSVNRKRKRGVHSKKRKNFLHHVREFFWPSMGWASTARFMEIRMKRTPGSAHKIALAFAFGVFVSFTPFVGLHAIASILLAWAFGGSGMVALIGTLVGNPWTFPFIWAWIYKLGNFMLERHETFSFSEVTEKIMGIDSPTSLWENLGFYWDHIFYPMTVGGVPTGILAALGFYWVIRFNIESWRKARMIHLQHKRQSVGKKVAQKVVSTIKKTKEGEE